MGEDRTLIGGGPVYLPRILPLARVPGWVYRRVALLGGFSLLATVLLWPILGSDYPPGVDTPAFLHLSWVTSLAVKGQLAQPLQDPYWYGGFPYLVAYSPLGFSLIGVASALTGLSVISVYHVAMVTSYAAIGVASYWLGRELGLGWWAAILAGTFVVLAYPVMASLFLWGWFTSVMALPFFLIAYGLIERAIRTHKWQLAAWGALIMSLAVLIHTTTVLSLGLGLSGWFAARLIVDPDNRSALVLYSGLFAGIVALVIAPWGIPFLIHLLDVGFQREVPGIWLTDIGTFGSKAMDSGLIGMYSYPLYLGVLLVALTLAGGAYALLERGRLAGVVVMLLVLTWFGMSANLNPIIRLYPLSGLDTSRFQLYMMPFMALLAAAFVEWSVQHIKEPLDTSPGCRPYCPDFSFTCQGGMASGCNHIR